MMTGYHTAGQPPQSRPMTRADRETPGPGLRQSPQDIRTAHGLTITELAAR
jgi:hypothetical protein